MLKINIWRHFLLEFNFWFFTQIFAVQILVEQSDEICFGFRGAVAAEGAAASAGRE